MIDQFFVLKMWRVKKLSLSPSPQPVSGTASWRKTQLGRAWGGDGGVWSVLLVLALPRVRGGSLLLPPELFSGGQAEIPGILTLSLSFSGKTSYENSSPRT